MRRRLSRSLSFAVALAAFAAPPAGAAAPSPPPNAGSSPTSPPVAAGMSLAFERQFHLGAQNVAMQGQTLRLRGTTAGELVGQVVTVRVNVGPRRIVLVRRTATRTAGHGEFTVDFRVARAGVVHASALHDANATVGRLAAESPLVSAFIPVAGAGARGLRVRFLQQRLARLHYGVAVTGYYNGETARAVLAYRKVNVMARVSSASRAVFGRLAVMRGGFPLYYPTHGRHVEADLGRQVLALVNPGGSVYRVYPMSSGKPSTPTVRGGFHVYSKTPGTNGLGMVDSNYFIGGYAIHGYHSVPTYAASHGCLRIPIPAAGFVNRWLRIGTRVDVFYRNRRVPTHQRINPHAGP